MNTLRLHHFLPVSRANGPGRRAVIWVQGCSLGCPGCFNPETHPFAGGRHVGIEELMGAIVALEHQIEGITLSGGEPLEQREAVSALLRQVKTGTSLSVILFTGFHWAEVLRMDSQPAAPVRWTGASEDRSPPGDHTSGAGQREATPEGGAESAASRGRVSAAMAGARRGLLQYVDVLITGRYDRTRRLASGLRGSANKVAHFLTDRYAPADLESVPEAELVIAADGGIESSGIEPITWAAPQRSGN